MDMYAGVNITALCNNLKHLAQLVTVFYSKECAIILDLIVDKFFIKESELAEILCFDKNLMRLHMSYLRKDHFVQVRVKKEPDANGSLKKQIYYYINYKILIDVVQFKLDNMSKHFQSKKEEVHIQYKCTNCEKIFNDLEANLLFDNETLDFRCTDCNSLVEENIPESNENETIHKLARFNEQLKPLYNILNEVKYINVPDEYIDPEYISSARANKAYMGQYHHARQIHVDITNAAATNESSEQKPQPIWLTKSALTTAKNRNACHKASAIERAKHIMDLYKKKKQSNETVTDIKTDAENDNVMSLLLKHENI